MRITGQTRDVLKIVGRKKNPAAGRIVVAGAMFTVPMLIGFLFSPSREEVESAVVFLALLWFILAIIFFVTAALSLPPRLVFDASTRRAQIGNDSVSFDEIAGVSDGGGGVAIDLVDGDRREVRSDSPPAERVAAQQAIRDFLTTHDVELSEPHDADEQDLADEDGEPDEFARAIDDAEEWAKRWKKSAASSHRCIYCGTRTADGSPFELIAQRFGLVETLYVPRCRHCTGVHNRYSTLPTVTAAAALFATFIFCAVVLSEKLGSGVAFAAAFIVLALVVPVAAGIAANVLTKPERYGTKPPEVWVEHPELKEAMRSGWSIHPYVSRRR